MCRGGKPIGSLIPLVPVVSFHPNKLDPLVANNLVEELYKVLVLGVLGYGFGCKHLDAIAGVGVNSDCIPFRYPCYCANDGEHFHAVIRGADKTLRVLVQNIFVLVENDIGRSSGLSPLGSCAAIGKGDIQGASYLSFMLGERHNGHFQAVFIGKTRKFLSFWGQTRKICIGIGNLAKNFPNRSPKFATLPQGRVPVCIIRT